MDNQRLEELRVKVAELCGWDHADILAGGRITVITWEAKNSKTENVPAYSTSYDAIMPEILKRQKKQEWKWWFDEHLSIIRPTYTWMATPAELCEAFIKTEEEMRR